MTSSFSLQFLMHFFLRSSCFQTSTTTTTIKNGEPCEKSLPLQELTNRQQHFTSWIYPILCFSEVSLFSIHISRLSCKQSYNWFALNHVDSNSFTTNEWRERERKKKAESWSTEGINYQPSRQVYWWIQNLWKLSLDFVSGSLSDTSLQHGNWMIEVAVSTAVSSHATSRCRVEDARPARPRNMSSHGQTRSVRVWGPWSTCSTSARSHIHLFVNKFVIGTEHGIVQVPRPRQQTVKDGIGSAMHKKPCQATKMILDQTCARCWTVLRRNGINNSKNIPQTWSEVESEFTTHVVREDSDDGDEGTCNLSLKDDGCENSICGTYSSALFRMFMLGI